MFRRYSALFMGLLFLSAFGLSGDPAAQLSEDLRFGGDNDDPNFVWPDTRVSLAVDQQGNIYVADVSESRVLKFDANGAFVKTIVHKGQGPGELEALIGFQVLQDGSARAYQYKGRMGTLNMYDKDFQFKKSISGKELAVTPLTLRLSPTGNWSVAEYNERDSATRAIITHVGLMDQDFGLKDSFSSTAMPTPSRERMNDRTFWVEFFAAISQLYFAERTLFAFDNQGRVYQAESNEYLVTRWNAAFDKKEATYKRKYDKRPWTQDDLDKLAADISQQYTEGYPPSLKPFLTQDIVREGLDQAGAPAGRNPLEGLIVTDDGKLLVILDEDLPNQTQAADVFDRDGSYLGRLDAPNQGLIGGSNQPRMVFAGGHAYTIETVDEDINQVVRYKVNWK